MEPRVDSWFDRTERWREESARLRAVLLDCGLDEALKWGKPCYSAGGNNIAIIQPMKPFMALMFFKGALLSNEHGALEPQGENSRSAMRVCFASVADVTEREDIVRACVHEAIEVSRAGISVPPAHELVLVDELQARLDGDPELKAAFEALTPGRRREYNLHVSGAKRAETRASRVDGFVPNILAGKGLRDR